jgi:hypothetical protein
MDMLELIVFMSNLFLYIALLAIALTYAGIFTKPEKQSVSLMKIARILFAASIGLLGLTGILLYGLSWGHIESVFDAILGLISGIVFIAAGICIFIRRKARLASLVLAGMVAINILFRFSPALYNSSGFLGVILHELAFTAGALTWAGIFAEKKVKNIHQNSDDTRKSGQESSIAVSTESAD